MFCTVGEYSLVWVWGRFPISTFIRFNICQRWLGNASSHWLGNASSHHVRVPHTDTWSTCYCNIVMCNACRRQSRSSTPWPTWKMCNAWRWLSRSSTLYDPCDECVMYCVMLDGDWADLTMVDILDVECTEECFTLITDITSCIWLTDLTTHNACVGWIVYRRREVCFI